MRRALDLAREAASRGEVPVGCVITLGEEIIGEGSNRREEGDATAHAEILAIREASRFRKDWHLDGCELYVTLEPCPMCAGAVWASHISKVWFGAYDDRAGACGGLLDLYSYPINHKPEVGGGRLAEECSALLKDFFITRRTEDGDGQY